MKKSNDEENTRSGKQYCGQYLERERERVVGEERNGAAVERCESAATNAAVCVCVRVCAQAMYMPSKMWGSVACSPVYAGWWYRTRARTQEAMLLGRH